jgi:hypothetical protein
MRASAYLSIYLVQFDVERVIIWRNFVSNECKPFQSLLRFWSSSIDALKHLRLVKYSPAERQRIRSIRQQDGVMSSCIEACHGTFRFAWIQR